MSGNKSEPKIVLCFLTVLGLRKCRVYDGVSIIVPSVTLGLTSDVVS